MLQYPTVYFLGRPGTAKVKGDMRMQKTNFGYDDERGDYVTVTNDHIAYRYEVLGILGKGSFGQVLKCLDHKTGGMVGGQPGLALCGVQCSACWWCCLSVQTSSHHSTQPPMSSLAPCHRHCCLACVSHPSSWHLTPLPAAAPLQVAIKIIRNKKRFHHQATVELKVLEHLRARDPREEHNVIHIQEHFTFRNHLCITFEMLSINLYEFIKQNNFAGGPAVGWRPVTACSCKESLACHYPHAHPSAECVQPAAAITGVAQLSPCHPDAGRC